MSDLNTPFLELAYYVGPSNLQNALGRLLPSATFSKLPVTLSAPGVVGVSPPAEAVELDQAGRILLRTEGEPFCGPCDNPQVRRSLGRIVRDRFVAVADLIDPEYGAILGELALPTPRDIAKGGRVEAFRDFYLGYKFADVATIERVRNAAGPSAYTMNADRGIYVALWQWFGNGDSGVDSPEEWELRASRITSALKDAPAIKLFASRRGLRRTP